MDSIASPVSDAGFDMSLAAVLGALARHDDKGLVIEYAGRTIRPGYHVTEVKAGSFVTLDCGGRPDAWNETILQVEDIPADDGGDFMPVSKFRSILGRVARQVELAADARLTFEVGPPGTPMQIFDVAAVRIDEAHAVLELGARSAICKPRHRAAAAVGGCCGPSGAAPDKGRCG